MEYKEKKMQIMQDIISIAQKENRKLSVTTLSNMLGLGKREVAKFVTINKQNGSKSSLVLKEYTENKKITIRELAKKCDVSTQYVYDVIKRYGVVDDN